MVGVLGIENLIGKFSLQVVLSNREKTSSISLFNEFLNANKRNVIYIIVEIYF